MLDEDVFAPLFLFLASSCSYCLIAKLKRNPLAKPIKNNTPWEDRYSETKCTDEEYSPNMGLKFDANQELGDYSIDGE